MVAVLTELHIENLGVIEQLDLLFAPGLTAVSGETGAGKTMIVEAVELLVGERADTAVVRHGADEARVDGRFVFPDGTETVVSRVIPAAGRSRAYVDGRLATVATLAVVLGNSVDLHGQHAHQQLLTGGTQRAALDAFGGVDLEPLRSARGRITEIDAALATLGGDEHARAREIDLLRYQIAEIRGLAIADEHEDERLDAEEALLADASEHRAVADEGTEILSGEGGVRDLLSQFLARLAGRAPFAAEEVRARDLLAELDDLAAEVRGLGESIDESPERLEEVRHRRQALHDVRRKYGSNLHEVLDFCAGSETRLGELESYEERAAALGADRQSALADEQAAAEAVRAARSEVAPRLAAAVQEHLRELAMPDAEVAVEVGSGSDDPAGEKVRFLLAANPGSPVLPLNRVASGGELARAMLALRLVLSGVTHAAGGTLVFDEVDAGIGGRAAHAVGEALAALGAHHQVLVVTHLAHVAALADQHVTVTKSVANGVTRAEAVVLDPESRVDEVARMLAGSLTDSARDHARELLG